MAQQPNSAMNGLNLLCSDILIRLEMMDGLFSSISGQRGMFTMVSSTLNGMLQGAMLQISAMQPNNVNIIEPPTLPQIADCAAPPTPPINAFLANQQNEPVQHRPSVSFDQEVPDKFMIKLGLKRKRNHTIAGILKNKRIKTDAVDQVVPAALVPPLQKVKKIPCTQCSSWFARKEYLNRHVKRMHTSKKENEANKSYDDVNGSGSGGGSGNDDDSQEPDKNIDGMAENSVAAY